VRRAMAASALAKAGARLAVRGHRPGRPSAAVCRPPAPGARGVSRPDELRAATPAAGQINVVSEAPTAHLAHHLCGALGRPWGTALALGTGGYCTQRLFFRLLPELDVLEGES
jgi:hypothetical protein